MTSPRKPSKRKAGKATKWRVKRMHAMFAYVYNVERVRPDGKSEVAAKCLESKADAQAVADARNLRERKGKRAKWKGWSVARPGGSLVLTGNGGAVTSSTKRELAWLRDQGHIIRVTVTKD